MQNDRKSVFLIRKTQLIFIIDDWRIIFNFDAMAMMFTFFSLSLSAKIISIKTLKHSRFISGIYVRVWVRKRARSRTCSSNVKQSKRSRLFTCCFISFRSADRPFIRFVLIFFPSDDRYGQSSLNIIIMLFLVVFYNIICTPVHKNCFLPTRYGMSYST